MPPRNYTQAQQSDSVPVQFNALYLGGFIIAAIFLLTVIFGSWFTVNQGERVVVLTNGRITSVKDAGIYFKAPFFQSIERFSTRTQANKYQEETYSKDIQSAKVDLTVNDHVDPSKVAEVYQNLGVDYEEKLVSNTVKNVMKVVFGQYTATESIDHRASLVKDMTEALTNKLAPFGIIVDNVSVENIQFSDEYDKAVEARMKAEVEVQQANQTLQQERIKADIVRTQAQAAYDAKVLEAKGLAAKAQALKDNENLVSLTAAEKWDGKMPTVMIPGGSTPMLNLSDLTTKK